MKTRSYIKQVVEEFNCWHDQGRADSMQNEHIIAVEQTLDIMILTDKMNVLDLGCGNGYAVRLMAQRILPEGMAYGIDISEKMIETANKQSSYLTNVHFQVADFAELPFEDHFFNNIMSVESIYYAEDILRVLKEVKRVLSPGGTFYCISYFFKEHSNSKVWQEHIPLKMVFMSEKEYISLFEEAGFKNIEVKRLYDSRPVDTEKFKPKWGYQNASELINFKTNIGALLVTGSHVN